MNITFIIEIIGTVAFASSGAMLAIRKRLDIFGVLVLGLTTAVGGGIIRDIILNITPPATFRNPIYMISAAITVFVIFLTIRIFPRLLESELIDFYEQLMNILDAIGLGAFTVLGIDSAIRAGHADYPFLLVFLGVLTGIGGGIIRDMMASETPFVLRKHIYACASILGAVLCVILRDQIIWDGAMILGAGAVILVRMLATRYRWNLPRAA
ncbi:MAG: trimeric intracellular cation channel family protein [Oscillospiraceae bacterium]|jgi:uncharacterized membrane protein YeiH|nr:trimeric intracellular cation channel family protein [Oscillospiraceae bacterium]